jgi:serine/threonine protein kinase
MFGHFYIFASTVLKLIDFGLAIQLGDDEVHQDNCGTEYYMAPELLDSNFSQPRTGKVC